MTLQDYLCEPDDSNAEIRINLGESVSSRT